MASNKSESKPESRQFIMIPRQAMSEERGIFQLNQAIINRRHLTIQLYKMALRHDDQFSCASSYFSKCAGCSESTAQRFLMWSQSLNLISITHRGSRHTPRSIICHKWKSNFLLFPLEILSITKNKNLFSLALDLLDVASSWDVRWGAFRICQKSLAMRHGLTRSVVSTFVRRLQERGLLLVTSKATRSDKMKIKMTKGTRRFGAMDRLNVQSKMMDKKNTKERLRMRRKNRRRKPKPNQRDMTTISQRFTNIFLKKTDASNVVERDRPSSVVNKSPLYASQDTYDLDSLHALKDRYGLHFINIATMKYLSSIGMTIGMLQKVPLHLVNTSSTGWIVDDLKVFSQLKDDMVLPRITKVQFPLVLEILSKLWPGK